jgi:hypothetical protein
MSALITWSVWVAEAVAAFLYYMNTNLLILMLVRFNLITGEMLNFFYLDINISFSSD